MHDLTPLVTALDAERGAGTVGRETGEQWPGGTIHVSRVPRSGPPLPLSALICGPDGGKTP